MKKKIIRLRKAKLQKQQTENESRDEQNKLQDQNTEQSKDENNEYSKPNDNHIKSE